MAKIKCQVCGREAIRASLPARCICEICSLLGDWFHLIWLTQDEGGRRSGPPPLTINASTVRYAAVASQPEKGNWSVVLSERHQKNLIEEVVLLKFLVGEDNIDLDLSQPILVTEGRKLVARCFPLSENNDEKT